VTIDGWLTASHGLTRPGFHRGSSRTARRSAFGAPSESSTPTMVLPMRILRFSPLIAAAD
jgi:hypothetical protein